MPNKAKTAAVEAHDLAKSYGDVQALKPTSFRIAPGSYFVLLGPSGGGKTTTLRLIGGLLRPTQGRILINGEDVTQRPPNKRNTSMVFQSYALFPHMTVEQNVSYGLKLRKLPSASIQSQVNDMLELVGLTGYNTRMPHELSGGQQQRVQLARSLVLHSDILLLDEPLAALDAKLRKAMCLELKHIQERVGITFVHVTHNQEEAMTVADRIAVMANGELVEEGSVQEIYERPRRRFTADFIGENNLFDGRIVAVNGEWVDVDLGFANVTARIDDQAVAVGQEVSLSIRSEVAKLATSDNLPAGMQWMPATYTEQVYLGFSTLTLVRFPDGREGLVRAISERDVEFVPGREVRFVWSVEAARLHTE